LSRYVHDNVGGLIVVAAFKTLDIVPKLSSAKEADNVKPDLSSKKPLLIILI
jgi:hypothetical protein